MILELLTTRDFETNHFIRMSNMVLFLEFDKKDCKTEFTILKKNNHDIFPISALSADDNNNTISNVFNPYSKWFYFNFIDHNFN